MDTGTVNTTIRNSPSKTATESRTQECEDTAAVATTNAITTAVAGFRNSIESGSTTSGPTGTVDPLPENTASSRAEIGGGEVSEGDYEVIGVVNPQTDNRRKCDFWRDLRTLVREIIGLDKADKADGDGGCPEVRQEWM